MMDDLMSSDFLTYRTFDAILGHISILVEIYRSSWSCMLILTYEIHTETMTCLLSFCDPQMEPLLSHFNLTHTFWHLNVIMLFLLGYTSFICGSDSVMDVDD